MSKCFSGYLLACCAGVLLLSACTQQSSYSVQAEASLPLYDEVFPAFELQTIESEESIFALDDSARDFVHQSLAGVTDPYDQMETLAHRIFDHAEFNLLYMADANTTATQTFHNRAANCLSMSIMTYAMAKEAGFQVRFKDIQIPEYWSRRDGHNVLNDHVNLVLFPAARPEMMRILNAGLAVDFDPQPTRNAFPNTVISKPRVVAMFYNNKGADALLAGNNSGAYAYLRAAINTDPSFDSAWVNLGLLYRRAGEYRHAEAAYQEALTLSPNNLAGWENLATLYRHEGRDDDAATISARVDRERSNNPYYHFILGEQAFDAGDHEAALAHYQKALSLDRSKHEIYFGLAKASLALGDIEGGARFIAAAKSRSRSHQDQERYQGKLDVIAAHIGDREVQ